MNTFSLILSAVLLLALAAPGSARQRGGREPQPPDRTSGTPGVAKGRQTPRGGMKQGGGGKPAPATATLSVSVTPRDSTVSLRGQAYRALDGFVLLNGLPPGTHHVNVRREGYLGKEFEISLRPGDSTPLSVSLERLSGFITVSPLVADAEINIVEAATGKRVGVYSGRADGVELPLGRYQVIVSKEGYRTAVREVVVEPAVKASIEPSLAPLPKPAPAPPRPAPPPFTPDYATRAQTGTEGKFVVVTLTGRSGNTSGAVGAVEVTLSVAGGRAYATNVSGMLTGYPCRVDLVRLENVAEYSFVEPPGAANQWARAVVRLRPKESKRPVRFLINWKSLRALSP